MRRATLFMLAVGLAACSESQQVDQNSVADVAAPTQSTTPPATLSESDLVRVCKAGQHHTTGTPLSIMNASASDDGMVRISYTRDDGKAFEYDCRVNGEVIQSRMIDEAGPGTGPGVWSGRGSTLTYKLDAEGVSLKTVFSDGSTDIERVEI